MPLPLLAGIGAGIKAIGGLLGGIFGGEDRSRAQELLKEAQKDIERVGAPPDLSREIILNKFKQAGLYKPELEQAIDLQQSKVSQIKEDASLRDAQTQALQMIMQRGRTGLTAEDRAAFNKLRAETARDSEAKRQQIMQSYQARGMGGAGAELAAQLQSAQGEVDRAAAGGDEIAAVASRNALQAMLSGGQQIGRAHV